MISVREANPNDVAAVTALFLRCWRESYAEVLPAHVIAVFDETSARELWERALVSPRPGTAGLVAVDDGRVVGVTRIGSDPDEAAAGHVFSLYVDPAAQGKGIGGLLLGAADGRFATESRGEATLWVFEANGPACRFYERHGWHPDGGTRVEAEFGEPEIRLRHEVG